MSSAIITHTQKVEVTEVEKVIVTEVVDADGSFVRAIRIYGAPDGTDAPPVIDLVLRTDTAAKIELTTPALNY